MPLLDTPVAFNKNGVTETATTWAEYYQYLWDGWVIGAASPQVPRAKIIAHLSDIDEAIDGLGLDTEALQDAVAAMLVGGTNVTLNYDDSSGTLQITAAGGDAETMRDTIGAAIVGASGVSVAVNDGADTITISISGVTISQVTGLQAALTSKLDATSFTWTNLSGKPSTFPPSAHSHTSTDVSDFAEASEDAIAALLARSTHSGITFTYDDATGKLTATVTAATNGTNGTNGTGGPAVVVNTPGATYSVLAAHLGKTYVINLSANLTISLDFSGASSTVADFVTLYLVEPASGGPYTVTFPAIAALPWPEGANAPQVPQSANSFLAVEISWNGQFASAEIIGRYVR